MSEESNHAVGSLATFGICGIANGLSRYSEQALVNLGFDLCVGCCVSIGIGIAIPSDLVSKVVADLRSTGRVDRGFLGVGLTDVPNDAGISFAAGITDVIARGPGARGGLKPGDLILRVYGQAVESARDAIKAITAVPPGGTVRLALRRAAKEMSLDVTVGRRPTSAE